MLLSVNLPFRIRRKSYKIGDFEKMNRVLCQEGQGT